MNTKVSLARPGDDEDLPLNAEVLAALPYVMRLKHMARMVYLGRLSLEQAVQCLAEASGPRGATGLLLVGDRQ